MICLLFVSEQAVPQNTQYVRLLPEQALLFINMAIRLPLVCYRLAKSGAGRIHLAKKPYG